MGGNQGHPNTEVADSKKAGGVSNTMVHCWIVDSTIQVHSYSWKPILTEENKGSPVGNGIGFMGPSGSNKVPQHDGPNPCG